MQRHIRHVHRDTSSRVASEAMEEEEDDDDEDTSMRSFAFEHPFSLVVSGPSGCGKTVWMRRILLSDLIQPRPQRILWCYGQWQTLYERLREELPHIEFHNGIPADLGRPDFIDTTERNMIVFDDLMTDAKCDQRVADLFTKGRHHRNLSVAYLTQNLFPQGKACRDIALNTQYLVLFNNPIDRQQVATLARRIYPTRVQWFMSRFERAVQRTFGYMVLDLKASTPESDRIHVELCPSDPKPPSPQTRRSGTPRGLPDLPSYEVEDKDKEEEEEEEEMGTDTGKHYDTFLRNLIAERLNADFRDEIVRVSQPYIAEGDDTTTAQRKAIRDLIPDLRRTALTYFESTLLAIYYSEKSLLFENLMTTVGHLSYTMSPEEAVKETVRTYAPALRKVLVPDKPN